MDSASVLAARLNPTLNLELKPRPRVEYLNAIVFRPIAHLVVLALYRTRVSPHAVVLANSLVGLAGAAAIFAGQDILAAVGLQAKTVLDNADGQLARARHEETLTGRFLDSELDLLVNAAVFAGLGWRAGAPWLAFAAFLTLTFTLSLDFAAEQGYRAARGEPFRPEPDSTRENQALVKVLRGAYRAVFQPQEDLIAFFDQWRMRRNRAMSQAARLAYFDGFTHGVLANLGLTTQLAAIGVCLALGAPLAALWLMLAQWPLLALLQVRRETLSRRVAWLEAHTQTGGAM